MSDSDTPVPGMLPGYLRIFRTAPLPNTTPQRRKHCSINFMDAKFKVDSLDWVLTGELANEKAQPIFDEGIVNRIFSDQALGFSVTSALVKRLDRLDLPVGGKYKLGKKIGSGSIGRYPYHLTID